MTTGDQAITDRFGSERIRCGPDFAQQNVMCAQAKLGSRRLTLSGRSGHDDRQSAFARTRDQLAGERRVSCVHPQPDSSRGAGQQALKIARDLFYGTRKFQIENADPARPRGGERNARVGKVGRTDSNNLERLMRHLSTPASDRPDAGIGPSVTSCDLR
ncbi:MAG: hypothetical protein ACT4P0_10090 [Panacagrimonas sp.]